MAGGTGVGGIKDSQGNYEIIGKGDSQLGTRGGTLLVPLGDAPGQTPGQLLVNAVMSTTTPVATAISLNVVAFTPASPPSPPALLGTQMTFTAGLDATGQHGVFQLGTPSSSSLSGIRYGLFLASFDSLGFTQVFAGVEAETWLCNTGRAYPNTPNGFGQSALEATFVCRSIKDDGDEIVFDAPCDGYITDVMALINAPFEAVTVELVMTGQSPDLVCSLAASGAALVRRATTIARSSAPANPVVLFAKGETFKVTFPQSLQVGSKPLVKISYVRLGDVL